MSAATWTGHCTGCARDGLEVASRRSHHERVLCRQCVETAAGRRRELPPPAADARDVLKRDAEGLVVGMDDATWQRWEAEQAQRIAGRDRPARTARQRIVDTLELHSCGYITADIIGAVCPLCRGPLAVTFRGELVELRCCDGCGEDDVTEAVLGVANTGEVAPVLEVV